jgi:predicted phage terminase large subunit-like protein
MNYMAPPNDAFMGEDPDKLLEKLDISDDREDCQGNLVEFIKRSWHILEPGSEYSHGWHIDYISEALMAVTFGDELDDGSIYNRLMIAVPPGSMKSLMVNVFWPAFEWGPCRMPHMRYICVSHSQELAIRDGLKMRRLVESDWFRERWPHVVLQKDQNQKSKFETTAMGFRQCCAINSITGARSDRIIADDLMSVSDAASQQIKDTTNTQFFEAIPTRLVNPKRSAIVVIQQRLAEDDIIGSILERDLPYDYLMLPMRYDPSRAEPSMVGLEDPRKEEGELLFPARFPEEVVARDELIMGPWAAAAQFQQIPSPRTGGVIKPEWIPTWKQDSYPAFDFIIAAVDGAYTTKAENDPSAMTVWGVWSGGDQTAQVTRSITSDGDMMAAVQRTYTQEHPKVMLMYAWAERLEFHDLVEKVQETMYRYGVNKLLIENKASGISIAQEMRRLYGHEDFGVQLVDPKGQDKLARLYSIQHLFAEGLIYAPDRSWADMVINQLAVFPKGKHDDLVDTTSMALKHLRDLGLLVRNAEWTADLDQSRIHQGSPPEPLYPV